MKKKYVSPSLAIEDFTLDCSIMSCSGVQITYAATSNCAPKVGEEDPYYWQTVSIMQSYFTVAYNCIDDGISTVVPEGGSIDYDGKLCYLTSSGIFGS